MFDSVSDKSSLSEKVISQVTDAIIGGRLAPGQRLPSERELAEQFGVSRTVVRDAIKTLSGRGILRIRRGAGIFVATSEEHASHSMGEVSGSLVLEGAGLRDLFELRRTLEIEAAGWAADRRREHHVDRLEEIVSEARSHAGDPDALNQCDARFHVAIAEASQNLVLVRVMLTLLDLLETARRRSLSIPGRPEMSLGQHEKIISAIRAKDPRGARRAMLEHLASVEKSILSTGDVGVEE